MSVLPSFKSAFSSFAEVEPTANVSTADDSALPTQHSNRVSVYSPAVAQQSSFLDHIPVRSQPQSYALSSFLQTTSTERTNANNQTMPQSEPSCRHVSNPPRRPTFTPLPLHLLPGGAPSFYFDNRPVKRAISNSSSRQRFSEQPPSDILGASTEPCPRPRQESLKRAHSPSVHAGAYKRPRSQSVSAGGSYVKMPSQCLSERHPNQHSPSHRREPITMRMKKSSNDPLCSATLHVKVGEGVTLKEETNSMRHLSSSTLTIQGGGRKLGRATSSGLVLLKPSSMSPDLSEAGRQFSERMGADSEGVVSYGQDACNAGGCGGGSQRQGISPNTSFAGPRTDGNDYSMLRGGGAKAVNQVTPAARGFSHRSAGSKAGLHGYNTRIVAEDDILEDSSSRGAIDVLGSPRQPSLNSLRTGRRVRGGSISGLTISQGPTASDLSLLLGESRDNVSQRKAGSARAVEVVSGQKNETADGGGREREQTGEKREVSQGKGDEGDAHGQEFGVLKRVVANGVGHRSVGAQKEEIGITRWKENEEWSGVNWGGADDSADGSGGNEAWRQRPKWELQRIGRIGEKGGSFDADGTRGRGSASGQDHVDYGTGEETIGVGDWGGGSSGDLEVEVEGTEKMRDYEREHEGGRVEKGGADGLNVKCPHCPRRLRNAVTLQNHVRVVHDHSGKYQCGQCGLTFMWQSTLGNHVRLVHEKQRPYACEECAKAFRWSSHLKEHYWVVHKREKPFKCETCGKTFGRKNNMNKHVKKHSKTTS